jgi:hypothetical protein
MDALSDVHVVLKMVAATELELVGLKVFSLDFWKAGS